MLGTSSLPRCRRPWRSTWRPGVQGAAQPPELPELLTPDEVAAWLKATRRAIYAKAERGSLPGATYIGRRLYFLRSELLRGWPG
jgi:excisionase family DNA binding protein